ncbi:MAG: SDR family oxidoreductase [Actinobacteria bacterium]|nr:SDR family oxidoreductase [Actinomycetota bacterium]
MSPAPSPRPRAIVTGASSGIGKAIARRLAEDHSADLMLAAGPEDQAALAEIAAELAGVAGAVETMAFDLADAASCAAVVARATASFGGLDWLASNAGIAIHEPIMDATIENFDLTYGVNVRGMFCLALESAKVMNRGGGGSIVCTTSSMTVIAEEGYVSYTTSKGAVTQLARALALDLAPYGIRVNALAPGWVRTPATEESLVDPVAWSKYRSRVPIDRAADPAEMAEVVGFLLSEKASYVSGALICADGGLTSGARYSDWDAELNPTLEPRPTRVGGEVGSGTGQFRPHLDRGEV